MFAHANKHVVQARGAGNARGRGKLREIAHHDRKLAGRFDVRGFRGLVVFAHEFHRVEGRDVRGGSGGRQRETGCDTHKRAHAHDLAFADTHGGRDAQHLTREHVFAQHVDAIAFAVRIDRTFAAGLCSDTHNLRRRGEAIVSVERGINCAAHEARSGYGGDYGRSEPAHRHGATVDRLLVMAVNAKRRLVAEIDFRSQGFEPFAGRSSLVHDLSCSPCGGPGVSLSWIPWLVMAL